MVVEATMDPVANGPHRRWTVLQDVNLTAAPKGWHARKLSIPTAFAASGGVELRWRFEGTGGNFMALDDLKIREVNDMSIAEEPEERGDELILEHDVNRRQGCAAASGQCTAAEESLIEAHRRDKENAAQKKSAISGEPELPDAAEKRATIQKKAADDAKAAAEKRAANQKTAADEAKAAAEKRAADQKKAADEAKAAQEKRKAAEEAQAHAAQALHKAKVAAKIAALEKAEKVEAVQASADRAAEAAKSTGGSALSASEPCADGNPEDCLVWAQQGECDRNPEYMHQECRQSCGQCTSGGCQDLDRDCETWAEDGECTANPDFMKVKCQRSCRLC